MSNNKRTTQLLQQTENVQVLSTDAIYISSFVFPITLSHLIPPIGMMRSLKTVHYLIPKVKASSPWDISLCCDKKLFKSLKSSLTRLRS